MMDKHSGRIIYKIHRASPATPAAPTASIHFAYGHRDEFGDLPLASNLVEPEIDSYINDLKNNLDEIGKQAKIDLRQARKETLKNVHQRGRSR